MAVFSHVPLFFGGLFGIGGGEMVLIFAVVLLLFGGKRMPELARGLGKSIREFKKASEQLEEEMERVTSTPEPAARRTAPVKEERVAVPAVDALDEVSSKQA